MLDGDPYKEDKVDKPLLFVTAKYMQTKPTLTSTLSKHWLAIDSDPLLYRMI